MIEFETALIASFLLLTDIICSGIAAWRANPQLRVISGASTSVVVTLVVGPERLYQYLTVSQLTALFRQAPESEVLAPAARLGGRSTGWPLGCGL